MTLLQSLCVESAMSAMSSESYSSSPQLLLLVSDGRIERDSRASLRALLRQMFEQNILVVMLIVEGEISVDAAEKDSILNMKEVSFENGKPRTLFMERYPFPYYIILEDIDSLVEVLGDTFKIPNFYFKHIYLK